VAHRRVAHAPHARCSMDTSFRAYLLNTERPRELAHAGPQTAIGTRVSELRSLLGEHLGNASDLRASHRAADRRGDAGDIEQSAFS
jgi:hypothetical protein